MKIFKIKAKDKPEFWPGQQVVMKLSKGSKYKHAIVTIEYVVWHKADNCWKYALSGWMCEVKAEQLMRLQVTP
jgi:hypothetical protein